MVDERMGRVERKEGKGKNGRGKKERVEKKE